MKPKNKACCVYASSADFVTSTQNFRKTPIYQRPKYFVCSVLETQQEEFLSYFLLAKQIEDISLSLFFPPKEHGKSETLITDLVIARLHYV